MKKFMAVAIFVSLCFVAFGFSFTQCESTQAQPRVPVAAEASYRWSGKAVSLRVLQQRLASCMPERNCPAELLELGGLTRLEGFVQGVDKSDWILLGQDEPDSPPLRTEDFVVALRNVWKKYVRREENTRIYENPGCSIDARGDVFSELQRIADRIQSIQDKNEKAAALDEWDSVCRRPQDVRVLGVPFDCHFSSVMIQADYFAKRLVDGSVTIATVPEENFSSISDKSLSRLKKAVLAGNREVPENSLMNRFEFVGGETKYSEYVGIVKLETCPVVLITEEEFLDRTGKINGTGRQNPLALEFAQSFTDNYSAIAKEKSIYLELEGLFRDVALARIFSKKTPGTGLEYLLESFPIAPDPENFVQSTLPGIPNVKDFHHSWETQNEYGEISLWIPSCGGVSINVKPQVLATSREATHELVATKKAVLSARTSSGALSWTVVAQYVPYVRRAPQRRRPVREPFLRSFGCVMYQQAQTNMAN